MTELPQVTAVRIQPGDAGPIINTQLKLNRSEIEKYFIMLNIN